VGDIARRRSTKVFIEDATHELRLGLYDRKAPALAWDRSVAVCFATGVPL
jgi:hypothetical protein